ncbi:unnamed protein product [Arabidopsis halleri]
MVRVMLIKFEILDVRKKEIQKLNSYGKKHTLQLKVEKCALIGL